MTKTILQSENEGWGFFATLRGDADQESVLKQGAEACPVRRVSAGQIEAAVVDQLRAVFRQPEIVVGTWRAARTQEKNLPEAEVRLALQRLDPLWDELFPAEQARIVQLLVDRVDVSLSASTCSATIVTLSASAKRCTAARCASMPSPERAWARVETR